MMASVERGDGLSKHLDVTPLITALAPIPSDPFVTGLVWLLSLRILSDSHPSPAEGSQRTQWWTQRTLSEFRPVRAAYERRAIGGRSGEYLRRTDDVAGPTGCIDTTVGFPNPFSSSCE